jgi:alkylation response protein AidB-like acyl-CoA dehydrogenase
LGEQAMPQVYKAPLKEIEFVLRDVLHAEDRTRDIPEYSALTWSESKMFLDSVATNYAESIALSSNQVGDREGCVYDSATKTVKPPTGFKKAFDIFRGLGLIGLVGDPNYGGSGMPHYLAAAVSEESTAPNFSAATYGGLTGGAGKAIEKSAAPEIKERYLPSMYEGKWTGTMCLTEDEAGSDLGEMKTKAMPQSDGSFAITGDKKFITCGEHTMAENIIHLVLARLPNAPAGTGGITLFLVPKMLVKDDGSLGDQNGVECIGIEENKFGIHGSSTCLMNFDNAKGWILGAPHKGMKEMFIMMNDARLKVAIQGLSIAEAAYQTAAAYAADRVQGKLLIESFSPAAKSVSIIRHANIRRDLVETKAQIEGYRALVYETAIALDLAEKLDDSHKEEREEAEDYAALLTPVLKSNLTDFGCETALKGIQIHGGVGYMRDQGAAQYLSDSVIATIYEGTNDIQALDFALRKVMNMNPKENGRRIGQFLTRMEAQIADARTIGALKEQVEIMDEALTCFKNAYGLTAAEFGNLQLDNVVIDSEDFIGMFGKLAVGGMWLKMIDAANRKEAAEPAEAEFCQMRRELGNCYLKRIMMPEMLKQEMRIKSDSSSILNIRPDQLTPAPIRA